ncbi:unnamed protein product, partial [Tenebrio molitor]
MSLIISTLVTIYGRNWIVVRGNAAARSGRPFRPLGVVTGPTRPVIALSKIAPAPGPDLDAFEKTRSSKVCPRCGSGPDQNKFTLTYRRDERRVEGVLGKTEQHTCFSHAGV